MGREGGLRKINQMYPLVTTKVGLGRGGVGRGIGYGVGACQPIGATQDVGWTEEN